MLIIEAKQTAKSLAIVSGVLSLSFLILIAVRIQITATGSVPDWLSDLYSSHSWSLNVNPSGPKSTSTDAFFIFAIILYYVFLFTKIGLAIYLWRVIPKDLLSTDIKSLNKWILTTVTTCIAGLLFLFMLNWSGALEFLLARILLTMTTIVDVVALGSVAWVLRILHADKLARRSPTGRGLAGGVYNYNPNHNMTMTPSWRFFF